MSLRRKRQEGEKHSPRELDQLTMAVNYLYHSTAYSGERIAKELGLPWTELLDLVMSLDEWISWKAARVQAKSQGKKGQKEY